MCPECLINACALKLGTSRVVGAGAGSNTSGMLVAGSADPFHTRIHVQPRDVPTRHPRNPNRPGNRSMKGITPGSLSPSPGSHSEISGPSPAASPFLLPPLLDETLARSLSHGPAPGCHRDGEDIYRCSSERRVQLRQGDQQSRAASLGLPLLAAPTPLCIQQGGLSSSLTQ